MARSLNLKVEHSSYTTLFSDHSSLVEYELLGLILYYEMLYM
jgi:hypothetical protein